MNTAAVIFGNFNHLQAMRIVQDVEMKLAGNENLFATAIKSAIRNSCPYKAIILTIKDCAAANAGLVAENIGDQLTNEILKFEL